MNFQPLFIGNSVVLSNGQNLSNVNSGYSVTLKNVRCVIGFQLDMEKPERHMSNQLLVETKYLGDETSDLAQIVRALADALAEDLPFTKLVGVRKAINDYIRITGERVKQEIKYKEFLVKAAALEEEYKHLHPDIISMVKNFDHHYGYSDDIRVYRRGIEREKVIKEELSKVGALAFFYRYKALL